MFVGALLFTGMLLVSGAAADNCPGACAKDAAYKYLEYLQCAAYHSDPTQLKVWHDTSKMNASLKSVKKSNPQARKDLKSIEHDMSKISLPTCYESRIAFFMLNTYMDMIKAASVRLNKGVSVSSRFGSLPSTEINAFTIVDSEGERIVTFNTELFGFTQQMTYAISPLVKAQVARSQHLWSTEVATSIVNEYPAEHLEFETAVLEFLEVIPAEQLLTVPGTKPLNEVDELALHLSTGMDLFAVGHEYSHVILNHKPISTKLVALGLKQRAKAVPVNAQVAVLSWPQELAADELGFQLAAEAARQLYPNSGRERIYALYGALYFFESMEILDEARFILEHNTDSVPYTESEKQYLRSVASGTVTQEQEKQFSYLQLQDHPPAWLRNERVRAFLREKVISENFWDASETFNDLGELMIGYADFVWSMDRSKMPSIIKKVLALQEPLSGSSNK
jgi:hypothetical protein